MGAPGGGPLRLVSSLPLTGTTRQVNLIARQPDMGRGMKGKDK